MNRLKIVGSCVVLFGLLGQSATAGECRRVSETMCCWNSPNYFVYGCEYGKVCIGIALINEPVDDEIESETGWDPLFIGVDGSRKCQYREAYCNFSTLPFQCDVKDEWQTVYCPNFVEPTWPEDCP